MRHAANRAWASAFLLCLALSPAQVGAQHMPGEVSGYAKISATQGLPPDVLQLGDQFGCSVASLGDLDGDGHVELAVGACGTDEARGATYVLFLGPGGAVLRLQRIARDEGGFDAPLKKYDSFGCSVASPGDLDGDGVVDLAIGALGDRDGGPLTGAVWILFLHPDGTVRDYHKIGPLSGDLPGELQEGDGFGTSVAALGDLDQDGTPDLAVGAFYVDDGGLDVGAVWVLFLRSDGSVKSFQRISATHGGFTGELDDIDRFGTSLAWLGATPTSRGVLAVGAKGDDDGGGAIGDPGYNGNGAVWILSLDADGTVVRQHKLSMGHGGFPGQLDWTDAFGGSLAALGDLDGDGLQDLAVGAPNDLDGSPPSNGHFNGAVWMLFLDEGGTVHRAQKISKSTGGLQGIGQVFHQNERFGSGVAPLPDLDGDGIADLAVGAMWDRDGGLASPYSPQPGAVWLLSLRAGNWSAIEGSGSGVLRLAGEGTLVGGEQTTLTVTAATSHSLVLLVAGTSQLPTPVCAGGALIPTPEHLELARADATGSTRFLGRWPDGLPEGSAVYFQALSTDAAGCVGASSALVATPP